ncbi:MAG: GNAT family N-acetyltransferase [Defluviitaleaceae bacterium]|nr:GNAT family N-acetyltransferase [Defluviitaleaceae bacterium]
MTTYTRSIKDSDFDKCIWIETGATPGLSYVADVWDSFTKDHPNNGEFSAAFYGDNLGGIGKLTRLYGSYAWLETLRVHPDYQGKGLGKAIYNRYMEQMEALNLKAAGMYTNYDNIISRSLAEKYGLTLHTRFSEYTKNDFTPPDKPLPPATPKDLTLPNLPPFLVLNRTFYPTASKDSRLLVETFTKNNWIYTSDYGILIMGYRFQPKKALHIAYMEGDKAKLLPLAYQRAAEIGAGSVNLMIPYNNMELAEFLITHGFIKNPIDYITLWSGL